MDAAVDDRTLRLVRLFDAAPERLFDAWTDPRLAHAWLFTTPGSERHSTEIDLRVGGAWRFVMTKTDGAKMIMCGEFREIVVPERIVQTERFEQPWYPGEGLNTTSFVEAHGKTTLTVTCLYDSQEIRDSVLKSGMESGASVGYDRLAEMLPTFAREAES